MSEQDVNADNSDLEKVIADAENLLNETSEVKEEIKEEIKEEVKEEKAEEGKEEVKEEVKEEIPDEAAKVEEKEPDHGEKSRLGRKVKYLEDKLSKVDSIDQKLDALFKKFEKTEPEEPLPELPSGEDVVKIVEKILSK